VAAWEKPERNHLDAVETTVNLKADEAHPVPHLIFRCQVILATPPTSLVPVSITGAEGGVSSFNCPISGKVSNG